MLQTPLDTATLKLNDKPDEWEKKKREKNGEIERKKQKNGGNGAQCTTFTHWFLLLHIYT